MTYGCYNRAPLGQLVIPAQDGHFTDGFTRYPKLKPIHFRMEKDCVYTTSELGKADKKCEGCRWRK
ncbi:hypothetical protein PSQ40_04855 [Curvibacter sp. HBC61]|uniref:Uncharacterized protein n=1 Tax=Curvibacter cyanobacteriorum TaxID=3026422 RepID=A0ABT5MV34_9BURK|nr:hypothetical protein [Curvibacter sp. HBC61]MDD0837895.1 hypothetical protein [Curvibacter sp. HBC61]